MEAYIGYINFSLNHYSKANPKNKANQILDLKKVFKSINPISFDRRKNEFVKYFTINSVEVCSSSRGCTPRTHLDATINKHVNHLTLYKNSRNSVTTDKNNNNPKHYSVLNIKAECKIGDALANVAIRVPKSGILGVKVGMSTQTEILVKDAYADNKIQKLMTELEEVIFSSTKIPILRPLKWITLTVAGWNLNDPGGGKKPEHRINNFLEVMTEIGKILPNHMLKYQHSEGKQLPRVSFVPKTEGPTIGVTNWLSTDFTGCKSVNEARLLSIELYNAYRRVRNQIKWNTKYEGPVPKSRRKVKKTEPNIKVKQLANVPVWNSTKKKYLMNGKKFNCMKLSKPKLRALAVKLDVNPNGFKIEVCDRIEKKIKK